MVMRTCVSFVRASTLQDGRIDSRRARRRLPSGRPPAEPLKIARRPEAGCDASRLVESYIVHVSHPWILPSSVG